MAYESAASHGEQSAETRLRPSLKARLLRRIVPAPEAGRLRLTLPGGEALLLRGALPGPDADITLQSWRALTRILMNGDHGFADSYLDGQWSTTDLVTLLDFVMVNETAFGRRAIASPLTRLRNRLAHRRRGNTRRGSRRNIAAHYDLGNAFYRHWLDKGMNYSSALYASDEALEVAQQAKLDRIAELLELKPGHSVLEIGCGWGALAERLVRGFGCAILGITLSREQLGYATTRLAEETADGRADLRLLDYRDLEGRFDRVASIEMVEAVGERYWPNYFDKIRSSLVPGGIAVLQAITIEETRFADYRIRPDFIQRYIFPGGMLPTKTRLARQAEVNGLALVEREDFGISYAKTLQEWRRRFLSAWQQIEPLGFDARFRRMWEYYLAYCEAGFRSGAIDVSLFKFSSPR